MSTTCDTRDLPLIVFAKGANSHLESLSQLGADALGLDWTIAVSQARKRCGDQISFQGNLDPSVLYASPDNIRAQVALLLEDATIAPGHVFNLGHGMNPDMPVEHAGVVVEAVHSYSIQQRARAQNALA